MRKICRIAASERLAYFPVFESGCEKTQFYNQAAEEEMCARVFVLQILAVAGSRSLSWPDRKGHRYAPALFGDTSLVDVEDGEIIIAEKPGPEALAPFEVDGLVDSENRFILKALR